MSKYGDGWPVLFIYLPIVISSMQEFPLMAFILKAKILVTTSSLCNCTNQLPSRVSWPPQSCIEARKVNVDHLTQKLRESRTPSRLDLTMYCIQHTAFCILSTALQPLGCSELRHCIILGSSFPFSGEIEQTSGEPAWEPRTEVPKSGSPKHAR